MEQPYQILGRIFAGLTTDDDIELGILQTHQCTPAAYRVCLGLDPDAPLSEVDRVLASYLGSVSDEALPEAYLALLSRLFVEGN